MKKLFSLFASLLALLTLCLQTALPTHSARAASSRPQAGDYACILTDSTFFYSAADEKRGMFLLPRTYYVRLLEYGNEYCRVEYLQDSEKTKRLVGYAKTNELTFVDYQPTRPYLYYLFEIKYRLDDSGVASSDFLTEIVLTCAYYGDYKIGSETYCYVLRGGTLGYVPKPANLTIPKNTEYEEWVAQQTPTDAPTEPPLQEQEESSPAQIAILIALCLLVPTLAALILKPPRRPPYETDG